MKKEKGWLDASRLLKDLMGTPLADVILVMESGEFSPSPEGLIGKGEVVIGELTVFEKALATVIHRLSIEASFIFDVTEQMINGALIGSTDIDKAKVTKNSGAHNKITAIANTLDNLFMCSIQNRLWENIPMNSLVGIRKGYRVVTLPDKNEYSRICVAPISMN